MALTLPPAMSMQLLGKLSYTNAFGRTPLGRCYFGFDDPNSGIFAVYHTKKGRRVVQKRHYAGVNPQTPAQQAWRAVFSTGRGGWYLLTSIQKSAYNERARRSHMTGFNLYMREYLSAHRL